MRVRRFDVAPLAQSRSFRANAFAALSTRAATFECKCALGQVEDETADVMPGNVTTSWIRSAAPIKVSCVRCA